jgi:hypothetical protein
MISDIFWSGLAIAALLIGYFVEHLLFNRNIDLVMVLASGRLKQYRSR